MHIWHHVMDASEVLILNTVFGIRWSLWKPPPSCKQLWCQFTERWTLPAVCSRTAAGLQCTCQEHYAWPYSTCVAYQACDEITDGICKCIHANGTSGQSCQPISGETGPSFQFLPRRPQFSFLTGKTLWLIDFSLQSCSLKLSMSWTWNWMLPTSWHWTTSGAS